jgi:RNA polymerase primary sigma factor
MVRLPLNKVGFTSRVNKAYMRLEQEFEREPSAQEIAELMEETSDDVQAALVYNSKYYVSLDQPTGE